MKLLMTADTVGGVWNYSLQLCRALARHDIEVVLATMGRALSPAQRDDVRSCRNLTLHESEFRLEWMAEPWNDVARAGDWLLDIAAAESPDIVHLNGYSHGALAFDAPVLVVGHSCVLSWWEAVHGCAAPSDWDDYRTAVTRGIRAADTVVAPTAFMLDALQRHYGPLQSARVVHNGCDADWLPLGARDAFGHYARHARLPEPLVLAAGRIWDASKNMTTLAAAAPHIRWPVCVAGDDTAPDGTRVQLTGVYCTGMLTQRALRQWYQRASIFVQPSLYEPFGLAPLEAAQQRCALVLADIPSLRELWDGAAVFVPPQDSRALADTVNRLAAQPLRLAQLADAARRRALQLGARRMARDYVAIYQQLGTAAHAMETACA
jgi:glycogen synthase